MEIRFASPLPLRKAFRLSFGTLKPQPCILDGLDKCTLSADDALHQVQNRAGIATTAASLQNIWDERRAELALENNRIFDLIRLGKVGEVVGEKIPAAKTNFHSFFPIPSEQITLNKALVPSPGYVY